jgi:hypothetical protein
MDDNMKDFIIDTILDSENTINFILNAQLATEIATELLQCGIEFIECDDFYELIKNNEILSIAKNTYEDGEEDYFFQSVLSKNGVTLGDDSDFIYIESYLINVIDLKKFNGQIIKLPDDEDFDDECLGDCNCCECEDCDCNEEIYEYYDEEDNDTSTYEQLSDLIEEYATTIESTNGCPDCIRRLLLEYTIDLLENFSLVKVEE